MTRKAKKKPRKRTASKAYCTGKQKNGKRCTNKATKGRRCGIHPLRKKQGRKRGPEKGAGGRPRVVWVDEQWRAFDSMCLLTDKRHRVAVAMGYDEKTIDRLVQVKHSQTFSEYLAKKYEAGNMRVLSAQYESAVGVKARVEQGVLIPGRPPIPTMQIWVGKQRLEQKDKHEHTGKDGAPIVPSKIEIVLVEPKPNDKG